MAIAFPVAGTSDAVSGDTDTTLTVSVPTGTTDGELLFWFGVCADAKTISTPTGLTLLSNASTGTHRTYAFFRKASSEPASYDFTVGTYSSAQVCCIRITGAVCDSTTDFTVATGGNTTNDQTSDCPDVVTPENTCVVLWCEGRNANQSSTSCNRPGATERVDATAATGYHCSIWSEPIATAGTVTGAQITCSGWGGNGTKSIAIKTAGAPAGGIAVPILMAQYRRRV